jgi:hypothetical protein
MSHNKAYRYVRISSTLGGGVNVDAVEALGYIGSTPAQDTDGDGRPDRLSKRTGPTRWCGCGAYEQQHNRTGAGSGHRGQAGRSIAAGKHPAGSQ